MGLYRRGMLLRSGIAAALLLFSLSCGEPASRVVTLPSGNQIKLLGIGRINLTKTYESALMLKYQTNLSLGDKTALRREVDEIWSVFQADVEKESLSSGIISAYAVPTGLFVKSAQCYNFVFEKIADHEWQCLDGQPSQSASLRSF